MTAATRFPLAWVGPMGQTNAGGSIAMAVTRSILIIEDEADLSELISHHLEKEGYRCRRQYDGIAGLAQLDRDPPDLLILDRMLPRMSGDDVLKRLRRDPKTASIPVIMLTAKSEEADELVGLSLGADDYVRKPVSMKVLTARVEALFRRKDASLQVSEFVAIGPVTLDRTRHEVRVENLPIELTATEFRILGALMSARGRVMERDQLLDAVLGSGVGVTTRSVDVHIAALRRKLGIAAGWIQTIRGVGYTFREPVGAVAERDEE